MNSEIATIGAVAAMVAVTFALAHPRSRGRRWAAPFIRPVVAVWHVVARRLGLRNGDDRRCFAQGMSGGWLFALYCNVVPSLPRSAFGWDQFGTIGFPMIFRETHWTATLYFSWFALGIDIVFAVILALAIGFSAIGIRSLAHREDPHD